MKAFQLRKFIDLPGNNFTKWMPTNVPFWRYYTTRVKPCADQVKAINETDTKPASHVIMDLDGVVLDSLSHIVEGHNRYISKWKKKLSKEIKLEILGRNCVDIGTIVTKEYDLPIDAQVYANGIWQIHREYFLKTRVKPIKSIEEFICYFKTRKIPIALVCNCTKKSFELRTRKHRHLTDMFCHIVLKEDPEVKRGAPHPNIYEVAASRFRHPPRDMTKYIVFESSINGIKGAKAAGMQTILRPDRMIPSSLHKEADVLLDNYEKFEPKLFEMPPM